VTEKTVLTKQDVQRLLGICERTLENWVRRGELPAPRRLGGRRVYWEARAFNAWLSARLAPVEQPPRRRRGRPRHPVDRTG